MDAEVRRRMLTEVRRLVEELPPDFSTLCRFRARLGVEGFETLFNQVVEQARSRGFITDRLHIIDEANFPAAPDLVEIESNPHSAGEGWITGLLPRRSVHEIGGLAAWGCAALFAARIAATYPPGPPPMTIKS